MNLPKWTQNDAITTGDFRQDMTHQKHLATTIVNTFEDYLDRLGVIVPNRERDDNGLSSRESNLYGQQYDDLVAAIENDIDNKLRNL